VVEDEGTEGELKAPELESEVGFSGLALGG
jgi:hypothetical protein